MTIQKRGVCDPGGHRGLQTRSSGRM